MIGITLTPAMKKVLLILVPLFYPQISEDVRPATDEKELFVVRINNVRANFVLKHFHYVLLLPVPLTPSHPHLTSPQYISKAIKHS